MAQKKDKKMMVVEAGKGPILVPVDFSNDARAAMDWACRQAAISGDDILVLHVVHDPLNSPGFYRREKKDAVRPMEDVAAQMMEKFVKELVCDKRLAKRIKTKIVVGLPVNKILKTAQKHDARMIVMGRRGRSKLQQLLVGSKAEHVIQLSTIPVVIVKAQEE